MQWVNFRRFFEAVKRINSLNKRQVSINVSKTVVCSSDVELAKKNALPIVALESTIITHGMPYPDNLKTAIQVENVVRKKVIIYKLLERKNNIPFSIFYFCVILGCCTCNYRNFKWTDTCWFKQ